MKIPAVRNRIRQDLLDIIPTSYVFQDESIDRAFLAALEDFSRFVPMDGFYDITIDTTAHSESFNTTTLNLTKPYTLTLSLKPLKYNTVVVTVGATTYSLNTDYFVDYMNGKISIPASSSIAAGATVVIAYYVSRFYFDLSSLPNLKSVNSVEILYGRMPEEFSGFSLIGSMLQVTTNGNRSQIEIPGGMHLVVQYDARHTPPDDNDDGSLQEDYVEIVIKGAAANLLFARAIQLELAQAGVVDTLSGADTYFTALETLYTTLATDLQSSRNALVSATTEVGVAVTQSTSMITAVASDLAAIASILSSVDTQLTNGQTALGNALGFIDTEVVGDIAAAITQVTNAVSTFGTTNGIAVSAIGDIDVADTKAADAETALNTGAAYIPTVNTGKDPATDWMNYAQTRLVVAKTFIDEGNAKAAVLHEHVAGALGFLQAAQSYIAFSQNRIATAKEYSDVGNTYGIIADVKLKEAAEYINTVQSRFGVLAALINVADGYVHIGGGFHSGYSGIAMNDNQAIGEKINEIQVYIAKVTEYRQQRQLVLEISEKLRAEGTRRYQDFQQLISDRNQTRRSGSVVATRQLGNYDVGGYQG